MDARPEVGRLGEHAVAARYEARGYRVVARNWRCAVGELDLVAVRGDTLVFCEVKTRRGSCLGGGFEAVDDRKRRKLRTLAQVFLGQTTVRASSVRFDVASVMLRPDGSASIELFEDAF